MAERHFTKVLVGVDFSPAEQALLSCLPELEQWGTKTLVLAHMIPVRYPASAGYGHEAEYLKELEEKAEPLRKAGLGVETLIRDSAQPGKDFVALAREVDADMMLVGSRSHNFLHRLFLGSFATDVLHHATLPVLIERIEQTGEATAETCEAVCRRNLDKVLLATDFSDQATAAEEVALALAEKAGQIHVMAVTDDQNIEGQTREHLNDLKARLDASGARTEVFVGTGKPSDAIASHARQDFTLIIVGKHGHGWTKGALVGSTSARLCEIAQRPVLVVPA